MHIAWIDGSLDGPFTATDLPWISVARTGLLSGLAGTEVAIKVMPLTPVADMQGNNRARARKSTTPQGRPQRRKTLPQKLFEG